MRVHVLRMAQRCDPAERSAVGFADGPSWPVGPGGRSGGRPASEVSQADTDGVRIRPWAHP